MDFRQLLNPSGGSSQPSSDASGAPPPTSRMAVNALLSGPGAEAPVPAFADSSDTPMDDARGFAPSAFELSSAAPPPPPALPAFDPLALFDPALLAAHVRDAMGAPPPVPRGASPASTTSLVPDSDDEGRRREGDVQGESAPVKLEEDTDVDIMGEGDETATLATLKASSSKGKPRPVHFASGGTSPAPSPGPSGLSQELHFDSSLPSLTASANPTAPPLSPSSYIHPRLDPSHPRPALPRAFEAYRPPRRATIGGDEDETDSEDEEARRRARRAQEAARKGKNRAKAKEDDEEVDDRLYCVCEELYDPERMMIACDGCEEWFHVDCVNIDEEAVPLVDLFFCPRCSAVSHTNRTTWKPACARPTCRSPAAPLSKYCSTYCGISVAAARLALLELETGVAPASFWDAVAGATPREAEVREVLPPSAEEDDLPALADLPAPERAAREAAERAEAWAREDAADSARRAALVAQLEGVSARRAALARAYALVQARVTYLSVAVRRWEALCAATAEELQREVGLDALAEMEAEADAVNERKSGGRRKARGGGKKKGPQAPTSLPSAQCGLDVRLVHDAEAWRAWVEGDGRAMLEAEERGDTETAKELALQSLDGVCLETRKKCDRHQGWQKTRDADFKLESLVTKNRLQRVDTLAATLSERLAEHDATVAFRLAHRARSCAPDALIPVEDYPVEQEDARTERRERSPSLRAGIGAGAAAVGVVNEIGDGVEVPDELLQYLSRAELRALKSRRQA
ncbi:COMPASS (complex proteins associated with Set1p) component [Rhodotorula kratochvilovae]